MSTDGCMKVFLVVVNDRHCDLDVLAFTSLEAACDAATETVLRLARHEERIDWEFAMNPAMIADDWCWFVPYSCESDFVQVLRRDLVE